MRMQEQGLGAAVVKVVGVLLLISLGCTRTLERPASQAQTKAQNAPVEQVATSGEAAPVAAETAPAEPAPAAEPVSPVDNPAPPGFHIYRPSSAAGDSGRDEAGS